MKATIENSHETEGQITTPYLDYLEKIFDKKFITANQSKFYTKDGKIDFKKLEQVLVKEGYSEEFARRLVNDLKNEKIKDEDLPKYKQIAKNDIDLNRGEIKRKYGEEGEKAVKMLQTLFLEGRDISRMWGLVGSLENWLKLSKPLREPVYDYAIGEINRKEELMEQIGRVKIIPEKEHKRLEFVLAQMEVQIEDEKKTGGRNYEAIAAAKNMQELKKVAIESGLFNEVTWNNLVNKIANMIMKHAEMLPYEQQQQQFITQILYYYYQQEKSKEIEEKKEESEKRSQSREDLEERKMREFAKAYVDTLKADGKGDIETLIINNLKENEKRLNNIVGKTVLCFC